MISSLMLLSPILADSFLIPTQQQTQSDGHRQIEKGQHEVGFAKAESAAGVEARICVRSRTARTETRDESLSMAMKSLPRAGGNIADSLW